MKKKNGFTKKYVILNSFQDLISGRPCDPEINSGRRKRGFTLAEVLITLGIIGVVAAMTIPTLMANNQKTQYVSALKKAYTTWNQVLVKMAADEGSPGDLSKSGLFAAGTTDATFGEEVVKYFNVVKICRSGESGCIKYNSMMYDGSTPAGFSEDTTDFRFITADGVSYVVSNYAGGAPNCAMDTMNMYSWSNGIGAIYQICGALDIDVNGLKGPNNFGRDIFRFTITNGRGPQLYPLGGIEDANYTWKADDGTMNNCHAGNTDGKACAARVIEEGWEMNY